LLIAAVRGDVRQIEIFTTRQGLPRNAVSCVVAGPNGMLWMCSSEGLVRFDGYHFRAFGRQDGLPSKLIFTMRPSRRGGFWLLTDRGLCRFQPDAPIGRNCELLPVRNPKPEFDALDVTEFETGETWVFGAHSLYRVSDDGRQLVPSNPPLPTGVDLSSVAPGSGGALLLLTSAGVSEWRPGSDVRPLMKKDLTTGPEDVLALPSGPYLVASHRGVF